MSLDLSKAVGFELPSRAVDWNRRDLLLYAVGIGAKNDDLSFVYELDKSFSPFPTYPVVLPLKGEGQDVNEFRSRVKNRRVPGLPAFDPNRGVHGTQSIEILRPIPVESGPGWKMKNRIVGVHENKSGIVVEQESVLVDASGTPYAKLYSGSFNIGAKAQGPFSKKIAGPPTAKPRPRDRKADHVVRDTSTPEQATVYRLSGDYNPLHIDPSIGAAANFGGCILHGLATFGFAARAVLRTVGADDPASLRLFGVRFSSPVRPGDALETAIWELGPGPDGTTEVAFETVNLASGKVCLGAGMAYVRKAGKSKL